MQTFCRQLRLLTFLLCVSVALPYAAQAQTSAPAATPAPLAPEAQDALKKGIIAAQQQDYMLAIRYFQDARKLAPDDPEIYKDLGLAESKIPGRELRAIAWFGAYLTASSVGSMAPSHLAIFGFASTPDFTTRRLNASSNNMLRLNQRKGAWRAGL